jgi:hypothetical protein
MTFRATASKSCFYHKHMYYFFTLCSHVGTHHKVVTLLQDRHVGDPLLSLLLIRIFLFLFLLYCAHVDWAEVELLVQEFVLRYLSRDRLQDRVVYTDQGIRWVYWRICFRRIFPSVLEDDPGRLLVEVLNSCKETETPTSSHQGALA